MDAREHASLIDALGGPTAVAGFVNEHMNLPEPVTPQAISMWKKRGIAHHARPTIADEAKKRRIPLPKDFLRGRA